MRRFWNSLIEPSLRALDARRVIEIGVQTASTTRRLLLYTGENGGEVHAVDPAPPFDMEDLVRLGGDRFHFHKALSLQVLETIETPDVVLLDGDHNWYTVFHELGALERRSRADGKPFPVVFLHDTAWPYGRRDLYYDPDTIPAEARKEFARGGLLPGVAALTGESGLNRHLFHGLREGEERSGVLTAVEDFLAGEGGGLEAVHLAGLNGMTLLFPTATREKKPAFASVVDGIRRLSPELTAHLESIEKERIRTEIALAEERAGREELKKRMTDDLRAKSAESDALRNERAIAHGRIKALEEQGEEARRLARREKRKADAAVEELREYREKLRETTNRLDRLEKEWGELRNRYAALEKKKAGFESDVEMLANRLDELDRACAELIGSRRWKIGKRLGDLSLTVRGLPNNNPLDRRIEEIVARHRRWREGDAKEAGSADLPPKVEPVSAGIGGEPVRRGDRTRTKKRLVSIVAWDLAHNPVGRAYLIAEALSRWYDVELIGAKFPRFGTEIWEPVRGGGIPTIEFTGGRFPEHFHAMERAATEIRGDLIVVCKPRLPSFELGMLARELRNRPMILDVDDLELAFFDDAGPIDLEEARRLSGEDDFHVPHDSIWTRYCDGIVSTADEITVSTEELRNRFGGTLIPHARDERVFDPALHDRKLVRDRLGFDPDDKVILFIGTPRSHKGILKIAEALEKLGNEKYKLCVIGTLRDSDLAAHLARFDRSAVRLLPDQPFSALPENLMAGDLVCLLQDPDSPISRFQMPAKFTDALAMAIPMIAHGSPSLERAVAAGLAEKLDRPLHEKIEELFSHYDDYREKAIENRRVFLEEFSYDAIGRRLRSIIEPLAESPPPPPPAEFTELLRFHRTLFSPRPNISSHPPAANPPRRRSGGGPSDDRYDIVFFWKQNDTGLYGRRQEMLVKYLARSPRVRRIVHFDSPIAGDELIARMKPGRDRKLDQGNRVARNSLLRALGRKHDGVVRNHTFLHSPRGKRSKGIGKLLSFLPPREKYIEYIRSKLRANHIGTGRILFWVCPRNFEFPGIARAVESDMILADVIDDNRAWFEPDRPEVARLTRNYREILAMSDVVLANCETVRDAMASFADTIHLVPNACEIYGKDKTSSLPPKEMRRLTGPVIGYVGNLSSRIDIELMKRIAAGKPAWNLVLIGSAHLSREILALRVYPNVHFLGIRSYDRVLEYIRSFDVAIIPHLDNRMTRSMNPLKLFVYCSLDVPVVATKIGNLGDLRDLVHLAGTHGEFIRKIENILAGTVHKMSSTERMKILLENSWERRVERIVAILDATWKKNAGGAAAE